MAISFRAAITDTAAGTDTHGILYPTVVTGDELIMAVAAIGASGAPATPAGWTLLESETATGVWLGVWRKTAGPGDVGSGVNIVYPGAVLGSSAIVASYSGADPAAPVDVSADFGVAGATTATAPSVTTTRADDRVVCIVAAVSLPNVSLGAVAGTTERAAVEPSSAAIQLQDYTAVAPGATGAKQSIVTGTSHTWGCQIALRCANRAPNAPTLTTPANGAARNLAADGAIFTGVFSDPDTGDTPSAYALRIDTGDGYEYWDEGAGALSPTEVKNTSTNQAHTIPAGILANGASYAWSVKYWDAADEEGTYAADFTVVGNTPPVVTVDDLGTVTDTTRPTISWSHTDVEGDLQFAYEVIVESGDFGTVPGSGTRHANAAKFGSDTSWTADLDLPNDTDYRVFVRVYAPLEAGQWSDWAYDDFDLDIDTPDAPTVTAGWDEDTNSATVEVTGNHDTGDFPDTLYIVEYSDDQGTTWQTVRGGEGVSEVDDHELPPFAERLYSARTIATVGGATVSSDRSATVGVTPTPRACWITDPLDPDTKLTAVVADFTRARSLPAATWEPVGRTRHMVTYGTARGYQGTLTIRSWDKATYDDLWDLLASRRTLLVQTMHTQRYVAVTGNIDEADVLTPAGPSDPWPIGHTHTLTVPVVEVDRP